MELSQKKHNIDNLTLQGCATTARARNPVLVFKGINHFLVESRYKFEDVAGYPVVEVRFSSKGYTHTADPSMVDMLANALRDLAPDDVVQAHSVRRRRKTKAP